MPGSQPNKVGRPARIDRDAIAEAVLELGLDGISMKAVADHLGVSVAGLYHHVSNRRELPGAGGRALALHEPDARGPRPALGRVAARSGPGTSTGRSSTSPRSSRSG